MQLEKKNTLTTVLAMATCSLLSNAQTQAEESRWKVNTGILFYDEDERVTAVEPVFAASKTFADGSKVSFKAVLDSLTGASHNGATISDQPQTFSGPSGEGSYTVAPGELPLDDTFKDTRAAISAQWTGPVTEGRSWTAGGNFSAEYDFRSIALNGGFSQEFNQKNTTLNLGIAVERDAIEPVGDAPQEMSLYSDQLRRTASENKTIIDLLAGVTQVINRQTIMQFNLAYSKSDGYLTDPYKFVSVLSVFGQPLDYVYENRPDSRSKTTAFWRTRHHLKEDIVDVSYRYMSDDWGIRSHTVDFHYRWQAEGYYIEPHVRFYQQTQADFYRDSFSYIPLNPGDPVVIDPSLFPRHVSSDYRLSDMESRTLGFKIGIMLGEENELSFRIEFYQQSGDTPPADLDAVIFQAGYSFYY